jgi:hypothetical protein
MTPSKVNTTKEQKLSNVVKKTLKYYINKSQCSVHCRVFFFLGGGGGHINTENSNTYFMCIISDK